MTRLIRTYDDLVAALRARKDGLNISNETLDAISGTQPGYCGKLFGAAQVKSFGQMSLPAVLGGLGVALVLVEDSAAIERVRKLWVRRKRPQRLPLP